METLYKTQFDFPITSGSLEHALVCGKISLGEYLSIRKASVDSGWSSTAWGPDVLDKILETHNLNFKVSVGKDRAWMTFYFSER